MKYVIGSGWWATDEPSLENRMTPGDDIIRSAEFHKLWYKSICKYTNPEKIFIVDSNSPIKPPLNRDDGRIEFVSLDKNYGHSVKSTAKFCGVMRSFLFGVSYAWMCDADYFVYVEQDCLVCGEGIIEYAIDKMSHPYMFGDGSGTPQPTQISIFIIKRSHFTNFLNGLARIEDADHVVSPEEKFARIELDWLPNHIANKRLRRLRSRWWKLTGRFWRDWLPFGYGRARPINWNDPYFYFQHGTKEEIQAYLEHTGLTIDLQ